MEKLGLSAFIRGRFNGIIKVTFIGDKMWMKD
jgi:hypothetical protein